LPNTGFPLSWERAENRAVGFGIIDPLSFSPAAPGTLKLSHLNGKRVGVRASTMTTGTWARNVLGSNHAVYINSIE
jgi:hypothetical protein